MFRDSSGRVQRVGGYALCTDGGDGDQRRLLMCRLAAETGRPGWWTIPGGGVDFGEHPRDAVVREVREETGYDVRVEELVTVDSLARLAPEGDGEGDKVWFHVVRVIYRVEIVGGVLTHELAGSTDLAEWHTKADISPLQLNELGHLAVDLAFDR